jgi:hypothetical protein
MAENALLSEQQLRALGKLNQLKSLKDFYLGGGTAVAYHLGHRVSMDLDVFSSHGDVDLEQIRREIVGSLIEVEIIAITQVSIYLTLESKPIDVVCYPYPPLESPRKGPEGFPTASLIDLATMKLAAIAKRGIKRDFWDLYEIIARSPITLENALDAYVKRFGKQESDLYYVIRSLTYFEDAEKEAVAPKGMHPELRRTIKDFFSRHSPNILK